MPSVLPAARLPHRAGVYKKVLPETNERRGGEAGSGCAGPGLAHPRAARRGPASIAVAAIDLVDDPQISGPVGRAAAGVVGLILCRDLLADFG